MTIRSYKVSTPVVENLRHIRTFQNIVNQIKLQFLHVFRGDYTYYQGLSNED